MIYEVYRRPSKPPPLWLMNVGAVVVGVFGTIFIAAWTVMHTPQDSTEYQA